ncbi:hypothetical protein KIN_09060 [Litoreibacter roseus]|uniref:Uncharacterized protein n=1 Tax=Litoreibacter roseus TaxID=2601869 RepID=A0A6N6JF44_9RHOB|nr:hypothetical protein KIN_09060 [Litoreibacter roseus]
MLKQYLFVTASAVMLLFATTFFSQSTPRHCSDILDAPPFLKILDRNEGPGFGEISSDRLGKLLLGAECDEGSLVAFFTRFGWEFSGQSEISGES